MDAKEHLLGQVLGETALADEAQHVVEDRNLIRADDERERVLVSTLCLPDDVVVELRERHRDQFPEAFGRASTASGFSGSSNAMTSPLCIVLFLEGTKTSSTRTDVFASSVSWMPERT